MTIVALLLLAANTGVLVAALRVAYRRADRRLIDQIETALADERPIR